MSQKPQMDIFTKTAQAGENVDKSAVKHGLQRSILLEEGGSNVDNTFDIHALKQELEEKDKALSVLFKRCAVLTGCQTCYLCSLLSMCHELRTVNKKEA